MDNKKGHNAEVNEWWTIKCNYCGKYGHSTRGCEANPHWHIRCDNCNNLVHIKANCIASQATIDRGMQQKTDWIAKGGGEGKGKKGTFNGKKGGKGDGVDKGKQEEPAANLNNAGGGVEDKGPV